MSREGSSERKAGRTGRVIHNVIHRLLHCPQEHSGIIWNAWRAVHAGRHIKPSWCVLESSGIPSPAAVRKHAEFPANQSVLGSCDMNYTPCGGGGFHVEHTAVSQRRAWSPCSSLATKTALVGGRVPTNHSQAYPHSYPQAYPPSKHVLDPCLTRRSVAQQRMGSCFT